MSKYSDNIGWALVVQNGHLRGFNTRRVQIFGTFVWPTLDAISAASVADGFWHQAALVVDGSGERLYLDGLQVGSSAWSVNLPGATTTTDSLQIGRYSYTNPFLGDLDEVTVWNRSLGVAEINYLKHRHLNGNEDGLVALWHFDENGGPTADDATGHGYVGTLQNSPTWVASSAPLVFNQVSSNALQFDGINGYVQVTHTNDLNSYPFTATAWFRTTNAASVLQGIVSKAVYGIADGWSLCVENGHLRGFFYINGTLANNAIEATSADSVADGSWHHAALVVDGAGGKLFLDGNVVGSSAWLPSAGSAGAPTTTTPLLIGRFSTLAARFLGDIDEVTVWNRALAATEVQSFKNLRLAGTETGLVAYWHFDEGSGTNAADATGHGHTGTLVNGPGPVWTGSTAFLGDGTSVIHTAFGAVQWTRQSAVKTIPGESGFVASAPFWVRRLDDFGAAGGTTNVSVALQYALQSALLAGPVPLANNSAQFNLGLTSYNAAAPQASAGGVIQSPVLDIEPQSGTQLDSVNDTFQLGVSETYSVNGGAPVTGETMALAPAQLLHFNGNLLFGSLATFFTSIANSPAPGLVGGGGINTQLAVNSGSLTANPAFHYGNGTPLNVVLRSNGDAQAAAGTVVALTGADTVCIQNICFSRAGITLSNNLISGLVTLQLPTGFSICTNFSPGYRLTISQLAFPNTPLDTNLEPLGGELVASSSSLYAPQFFAVDETKPFWIQTSALKWVVHTGQILIENPRRIQFVRQMEDDLLAAQTGLVEPDTTNRVSNDGYYRNAALGAPALVTVVADANGVAHLSARITLNPPELRPHFPYAGRSAGTQIPTAPGGQLVIQDDLIDTTNSFLHLAGPVPASYARDCADTNCSAAMIGSLSLPFIPDDPNRLGFTPDGGLLAYGAVVQPQNLAWGFAGGSDFAQRTSDISGGAYHIPGTFLRSDQTALGDSQRPAVLLYTGFGDAANPAYVERPGQANYPDGLANYAGLNFRAPTQGRSFIANQLTDWYPLTARSKYYLRFGGVSGIHESASFPTNLSLYGYAFTFSSYRLSYLDSENWESRTDGALALPYPSGFPQEFARMKFACRGALDSAQVPASSGRKHMLYWDAFITPQTIEFRPLADDLCGTSDRVLVLGVETKLPFIPQAFHATLGFKTNGNLVTALNPVRGADSRFPLPGKLTLQGPGGSFYPLSTAGDGYFNNWETAGKPANGFYNIAGKIRTPFFGDIKVHLHITPRGANGEQVDIMGGWPAADGSGANRGWNVGTGNFFNVAKFDRNHDGFPGVDVEAYRKSPSEAYRPRAQRVWIEVAVFDYPLEWNPALRQFAGFAVAPVILPIIDVNSRLKQLSPGKVDFDFSQDLSLQLPALKVLDFANDAFNEVNAPINTVSNAIRQELEAALSTAGLTSGFRSLQKTLREDASGFFRPMLPPALNPVVTNLYNLLAEMERTNAPGMLTQVPALFTSLNPKMQTAVLGLNGAADQANTVLGQVNQTLTDVDDTIGLFLRVLEKDDKGGRHVVRVIIEKLMQDQGQFYGLAKDLDDDLLSGLLTDLEPTLAKVQAELQELRTRFGELRLDIGSATGDFSDALNATLNSGMDQYVQSAGGAVSNLLATAVTPAGDYFTSDPEAARQALSERLTVAFLSSPLPANYQQTFKQFLSDDNFALDQLMDVLFDQINRSIRDGVSAKLGLADQGTFKALNGIRQMSQSLLSAKIRGAPTFEGDSLRRIHLDSDIQLNLPDQMNFRAFMEIKELTSQSVALGCIPAGAPAAEVTLGAKDVPLQWPGVSSSGGLTLTVDGRWTLQSGKVLGIGGLLDIKGEASFKGCKLKEIGATFAIGETENYFAAKAAGTITLPPFPVPIDVQAGIFVGQACSLDPLKWIDPDVGKVLGNPANFSGLYVQYGGGVSLSKILFGSSTCLLDAEVVVSTALYYEGGPRSGKIGFRQKDSLDLSLLCVLSGHVDVTLAASAGINTAGYELDVMGSAGLCGKIGYCPFCLEGCKTITLTGIVKDGSIDYSLDY